MGIKQIKNKDFLYNEYKIKKKDIKQIAKEQYCAYGSVWYWLNKFEIRRRVKHGEKILKPELISLVKKGLSDSEIASYFDVTKHGVQEKRLNLGIRSGVTYNRKLPKYNLSHFEKGFLIGFLEGEGNIGLHFMKNRSNQLVPEIGFTNTDLDLIKKIQNMVGGTLRKEKRRKEEWSDIYRLRIFGIKNILALLQILEPYLISKKDVAQEVIAFCKSRLETLGTNIGYSINDFEIYKKVKELNKRGEKKCQFMILL